MGKRRKRKNPSYGVLPLIAAIPAAYLWIGGAVVGTSLIGGSYVYNRLQIDTKQYDADVVMKNAIKLIQDIEDGYISDDADPMKAFLAVKGISTSATRSPPTERAAYAQAAIYLAVASAMDNGSKELLGKAQEAILAAEGASQDATPEFPMDQKMAPLKGAMEILVATQNKRFYPVVQRLMFLARESGIQDTVSDVKKYSTGQLTKDALEQSVEQVLTPFTFVGGLWSGINPFSKMKKWQWQVLRWSVIGGVGYVVYRKVHGFVRVQK